MDGCFRAAVATCLARIYSNPDRVIARPVALRKSSVSPLAGRTTSQAFNAAAVSFHRGSTRSRRPLPMTWMLAIDLVDAEADEFGHAQAGSEGQMQHRPIADAGDPARVRRVEQSLHLVAVEMSDEGLIDLLHRDRPDPACLIQTGREPILEEAEEGFDGGKTDVAGARRVAASFLDVFQEGENERRIKLLNLDAGRGNPQSGSREAEEQLKAVGVSRAGVRARSPLVRQISCRRAHKNRQRPSQQPDRRSPPVGLHPACGDQARALRASLTIEPADQVEEELSAGRCDWVIGG